MNSRPLSASASYERQCVSSRSRSAYHVIYPATVQRSDWLALKLGWLLTHCLDAPRLVFRDEETFHGVRLEGLMREQAARTLALRRAVAKCEKGARLAYTRALERLHRLHREILELSIGYADSNALCPFFRPPREILFAFPDYYERCCEGLEDWRGDAPVHYIFRAPDEEAWRAATIVIPPEQQEQQCEQCGAFYFPVLGAHDCRTVKRIRDLRRKVQSSMEAARRTPAAAAYSGGSLRPYYVSEAREAHRVLVELKRIERSYAE